MADKRVGVRLVAEGGKKVRAELEGIGGAGQKGVAGLNAALAAGNARLGAFSRTTGLVLASVKRMAFGMASSLLAGGGISLFATRAANALDQMTKAARRVGEGLAGFRAITLAAGEMGVEVSTVTDSVQTMNRELAKGTTGATSALAQLGIDAAAFRKERPAQQLATLADAIQKTGASTGATSALLQQLGVRNKEMILALVSGGEAFRQAQRDIEDYGLAMSAVDSAKIEEANDRIGRLSLVGQFLGDRLATLVVPALGRMALAITDSLREGGLLRAVLDGLINALGGTVRLMGSLVTIVGSVGSAFAGAARWVWDTTGGFFGLGDAISKAWGLLTSALGWAYSMVTGFADLITATGSFGGALKMLADVAVEVWGRIGDGVSYITNSVAAMSAEIDAYFLGALRKMAGAWVDFTWTVADGINALFGTNLRGASAVVTQELAQSESAARSAAEGYSAAANAAAASFKAPLQSVQAMKDAIAASKQEIEGMKPATDLLTDSLTQMGGAGGAAGKAVKDAVKDAADAAKSGADAIGNMFVGVLDGSKKLRQAVADLIMEIAKMQMMKGFQRLLGAGGPLGGLGSWLGRLLTPNALGGVYSSPGLSAYSGQIVNSPTLFPFAKGIGLMGEAGPEAILPLSRGPDGKLGVQATQSTMRGSGGGGGATSITMNINVEGANGDQHVISLVEQGVKLGIGQFRNALPELVSTINRNPRRAKV